MPAKRGARLSKKTKNSQTFSMDVMIALGIFLVGIIVFLYMMTGNNSKDLSDRLASDSETLPLRLIAPNEVSTTNSTIVVNNKVDKERLNLTLFRDYDVLKREMDVNNDFCIHFEDENGNVVDLDDRADYIVYSIGNPDLNITVIDVFCARTIRCGEIENVSEGRPDKCP